MLLYLFNVAKLCVGIRDSSWENSTENLFYIFTKLGNWLNFLKPVHNLCFISTKCLLFHNFIFFCSNNTFTNNVLKFKYPLQLGKVQTFYQWHTNRWPNHIIKPFLLLNGVTFISFMILQPAIATSATCCEYNTSNFTWLSPYCISVFLLFSTRGSKCFLIQCQPIFLCNVLQICYPRRKTCFLYANTIKINILL
jgi:hypothetical protein